MRGHATRHDAPENFIMGPRTVTQQPYRRANSKSGQTNELTNTPSRLVKRISFQFLMHIIGCFDEQMPRLCSTIYFCCDRRKKYVMSPISCSCTTITDGLNYFVKTILGKLLFVLVFALISINLTASCFIIIPYELLYKSSLFVAFLAILGLYVAVNVSFHYYMAACTSPGSPVESDLLPRCFKCGGHKPERTHHCSFCDICVLNMDHHCIWIGQCVGAKNHRYFFSFLMFAVLGTSIYISAAFNTFYYNFFNTHTNRAFCNSELEYLPWFNYLCDSGNRFVSGIVFFTYVFCCIITFVVGLFAWFHFSLISAGETTISILIIPFRDWFKLMAFPFRHPNFKSNWILFLGLNLRNVSFLNVLFPSRHKTDYENSFDDIAQQPLNDVLVV